MIFEKANSTTTVGTNLISDEEDIESASYARVLTHLALVGGGGAGDAAVEVFIGSTKIARITNTKTGDSPDLDDYKPVNMTGGVAVPAQSKIAIKVVDAPASGNLTPGLILAP